MVFKRNKKSESALGKAEDSLHVVEFSQGKPNELSFNVLGNLAAEERSGKKSRRKDRREAKKAVRYERKQQRRQKSRTGQAAAIESAHHKQDASVGTYEQSAAFMGSSAQDEIRKRQKARRTYRVVSIVFVVSACLAIVGGLALFGYNQYIQLQSNQALIREACDGLERADSYLVPIDEFFMEPFNDETVEKAQDLIDSIPLAKRELEAAREEAEQANSQVKGDSRDKEAADYTLVAVSARIELLDVARDRLQLDIKAKESVDAMSEAQGFIMHANADIVEAAKLVADTTNENVQKANEKLEDARRLLEKALANVGEVEVKWSGLDVSAIHAYVEKRMEQVDFALASDAAILVFDRATAEDYNNKYNEAEKQASELAKSLPDDFTRCVVDLYSTEADALAQEYANARRMVGTADASIRKYLGIETQPSSEEPSGQESDGQDSAGQGSAGRQSDGQELAGQESSGTESSGQDPDSPQQTDQGV